MSDSPGWLLEEHTATQEFRASHTPGTRGTDQQRRIRIFSQKKLSIKLMIMCVQVHACCLSVYIRHISISVVQDFIQTPQNLG